MQRKMFTFQIFLNGKVLPESVGFSNVFLMICCRTKGYSLPNKLITILSAKHFHSKRFIANLIHLIFKSVRFTCYSAFISMESWHRRVISKLFLLIKKNELQNYPTTFLKKSEPLNVNTTD